VSEFKRIFGYSRVSTAEQAADNRTSLASQEQAIKGVGMIHGIEPVEIYSDPGVSGGVPLAERPAGARLTAALQPGVLVVASKLDRIFRSASDALQTVDVWKRRGVDLVLVDCGADPVSSNGASKLFFGILASVAEFERGRIRERMLEGKAGKKARGGHAGGLAPYGYRIVGSGRAAMLEIDEGEQGVVRYIHELRAQRLTIRAVVDRLTGEGITLRNGSPFRINQVHRIIHATPRDGVTRQ
jgi:DNA invertase Pin-like site-specific DNA recombinase